MTHILEAGKVIRLAPFANLVLVRNPGISFGMFADIVGVYPLMASALKIIVVAILLVLGAKGRTSRDAAAFSVLAGGAAGNILDRIRNGAVTDFIDLHAAGWHWPAFNLADVFILTAAAMLVTSHRSPPPPHPDRHEPKNVS